MSELAIPSNLPPASDEAIATIRRAEEYLRQLPQTRFQTEHTFHAGMYARTVRIPAGTRFTSVLIKIPTIVIVHGTLYVLVGDEVVRMTGYNVLTGSAGRKTAYITGSDIEMTMLFPTTAKTVAEAEAEFTDEPDILLSRINDDDIVVTESPCLESPLQPHS